LRRYSVLGIQEIGSPATPSKKAWIFGFAVNASHVPDP
jgi:hypothetical protein